jgi:hypothetical protein
MSVFSIWRPVKEMPNLYTKFHFHPLVLLSSSPKLDSLEESQFIENPWQ